MIYFVMTISIILLILIVFLIIIYNRLVFFGNQVENSLAQIDVELQRRFDLIPNLVETVIGYMEHEEHILAQVTELRTHWLSAQSISEKAELDNRLDQSLRAIIATAENYPNLKANSNFLSLQDEIKNTENRLATSKEAYNNSVVKYNTKLEIFPNNIIAKVFRFDKQSFFKVADDAKNNVKISF